MKLKAIILAAGAGTRMKSKIPKVLHKVCGETMLNHVINTAKSSKVEECIVIVGHGAKEVEKTLPTNAKATLQKEQLGTGHAVMMAYEELDDGIILVLCGDGPLITSKTIDSLIEYHQKGNYYATVLTTDIQDPTGYGRIIRNENQQLEKIVEQKDASDEQREILEINSGIYCFDSLTLKKALPMIKNENTQGEYYLTDILAIIKGMGLDVGVYKISEHEDIMAVNSREQLAQVEAIMRKRILKHHMDNGVTIIDPSNTYIGKNVEIGIDTILYPGVILEGKTIIGQDCILKQNCRIENSIIGNGVQIESSTIIDSKVEDLAAIGPYAYLRPHSHIGKKVKIGDFVEVKNATIGEGSKASHLAYIGDAHIGKEVNIGCGVVFVNYDGENKHQTTVKDNAFIGSNSNLVAPVIIEEWAYIAAGSTITKNVQKETLAIERNQQQNKEGWVRRRGLIK